MGIDVPDGHIFTAEDAMAVDRALLRFTAA
jgi:hypothetical protein